MTFLRSQRELFERQGKVPAFIALVSRSLQRAWAEHARLIEEIVPRLPEPIRTEAVASLIQSVFWMIYKRDPSEFPPGLNRWLLDQVLCISDFDDLNSMQEWRLDELIKSLGKVSLDWLPNALKQRAALERAADYKTVSALSHDMVLGDYVEPIEEGQREDPRVLSLVDEMLELVDDRGTVGYRLADVLHEIDPDGHVVAERIAERIRRSSRDAVDRLARLARAYVVETPPWRTIAAAVLELTRTIDSADERRSLYRALAEVGVRSWSGTPGEVPSVFVSAVERAQRYRDRETNDAFRPYWDWYLSVTEADLRYQEQRAREERGE